MNRSVRPVSMDFTDGNALDGLPMPTRTFSIIPSFKALSPTASPQPNEERDNDTASSKKLLYGHRRQHSEPLSSVATLISASDSKQVASAGASPTLQLRADAGQPGAIDVRQRNEQS